MGKSESSRIISEPVNDTNNIVKPIEFPPLEETKQLGLVACQNIPFLQFNSVAGLINNNIGIETYNNPEINKINPFIINYNMGSFVPILKIENYTFFIKKDEQINISIETTLSSKLVNRLYICRKDSNKFIFYPLTYIILVPFELYISDRGELIYKNNNTFSLLNIMLNYSGSDKDKNYFKSTANVPIINNLNVILKDNTTKSYKFLDFLIEYLNNFNAINNIVKLNWEETNYTPPVINYMTVINKIKYDKKNLFDNNYNLPDKYITNNISSI